MYCNYCGTPISADQAMCAACGKSAIEARTAVTARGRVAGHIGLLGVLWYVRAIFWAIPAVAMAILRTVIRDIALRAGSPAADFLPLLFTGLGFLFAGLAAISFATGYGLRNLQPWGRTLALVMGFLSLLDPPFGTALGIYTLYVLLPDAAEDQYGRMVAAEHGYPQAVRRPA